MDELTILYDLLIIFAAAVVIVIVFRKLGFPAIAGFIFAGFIVGPKSTGLIRDIHQVELLAEVGVVLLLFGIGLEISLDRLKKLWSPILIGGSIQVTISILVVAGISYYLNFSLSQAVFIGFLVAVSSTAIVLRGLEERGEIDAPHGRISMGILLFQDFCVVPMILLIPILAGEGGGGIDIFFALLKSVLILMTVVVSTYILVPKALHIVAKTGQRDLFVLTVFLSCIGTAWLSTLAGVSLALGAFLGGLVVAGSEYRHQALSELIPFREILTSIFFISIGMLLDPHDLVTEAIPILTILLAIVLGKFCIVFLTAAIMKLPLRVCVLSGIALSQVGEFAFVMIKTADGNGLLNAEFTQNFIAASILSMALTPVALKFSPHIAAGAGLIPQISRFFGVETAEAASSHSEQLCDHTIIAGYGIAGRELSKSLEENHRSYLVVDINPNNVQQANSDGVNAFYGDVTSREILGHLGITKALELVIVINDHNAAVMAAKAARSLSPDIYILARAKYFSEMDDLVEAGVDKVILFETLSAIEVVQTILARNNLDNKIIENSLNLIRECRR